MIILFYLVLFGILENYLIFPKIAISKRIRMK